MIARHEASFNLCSNHAAQPNPCYLHLSMATSVPTASQEYGCLRSEAIALVQKTRKPRT